MDLLHAVVLLSVVIMFAVSTITDVILFKKIMRTKIITTENNREILDHDKTIWQMQEEIENLKKAK